MSYDPDEDYTVADVDVMRIGNRHVARLRAIEAELARRRRPINRVTTGLRRPAYAEGGRVPPTSIERFLENTGQRTYTYGVVHDVEADTSGAMAALADYITGNPVDRKFVRVDPWLRPRIEHRTRFERFLAWLGRSRL